MTVRLRDYRPSDRGHLARCLDAMMDELVRIDPWKRLVRGPRHAAKFIPHLLREVRKNAGFVLVAEVDRRPVGVAVAWIRRLSPPEREAEAPTRMGLLSDLSVLPAWPGRGIGSQLIAETERRFLRAGCDQTSLGVFFPNRDAQRLYRRRGYAVRAMWMVKRFGPGPEQWPPAIRPKGGAAAGRKRRAPGRRPPGRRRARGTP